MMKNIFGIIIVCFLSVALLVTCVMGRSPFRGTFLLPHTPTPTRPRPTATPWDRTAPTRVPGSTLSLSDSEREVEMYYKGFIAACIVILSKQMGEDTGAYCGRYMVDAYRHNAHAMNITWWPEFWQGRHAVATVTPAAGQP